MAFTNNMESTTEDLAGIEKERSARGETFRVGLPLLAVVFCLGVAVGFVAGSRAA
jgi:uncharacterized membrane protein YoaK (UPF0700 family)